MRYFSQKEVLIGFTFTLWMGLLFWFFAFSDKTVGDVGVNLITDILFAVFVVSFIEYANKTDRDARNRARQRAVALSVRNFYQKLVWLLQAMVADGVASSNLVSLPTHKMIFERAKEFRSQTLLNGSIFDKSLPYAAYFICEYTGSTAADVFPARTTNDWVRQLVAEVVPLYRDVFALDSGFLPDEVVDSLTMLKDFHLVVLARDVLGQHPMKFGYWIEEDLGTAAFHLSTLQRYFASLLGNESARADVFLRDAVLNAISKKAANTV